MNDAQALADDLKLAREHVISVGILTYQGPDKFMDDLVLLLDLPPSVVVIKTTLEDGPPTPNSDPELTQRRSPSANPPMKREPEQRTVDPFPAPAEPNPQTLARVVTMARRRHLRVEHYSPDWIILHSNSGATPYEGSVLEVYEALKQDTLAKMPPSPAEELRERLSRANAWGTWTLHDDGDGQFTLCRNDERMFSGTLETVTAIAGSRILNSTVNLGFPE